MDKPDVDYIEGLSPAISIDQKGVSHNPRSTVGTVTEIYDYLRLLFARIGHPHCSKCGRPVERQTVSQIVDAIINLEEGSRITLLAPKVRRKKGEHKDVFESARKAGFVRIRVNGQTHMLDETDNLNLNKQKWHYIELVVDRLVIRPDIELSRVAESVGDLPAGGRRRHGGAARGRRRAGLLGEVLLRPVRHQPARDRAADLQLQQSPRGLLRVHRAGLQAGHRPGPGHIQTGTSPCRKAPSPRGPGAAPPAAGISA